MAYLGVVRDAVADGAEVVEREEDAGLGAAAQEERRRRQHHRDRERQRQRRGHPRADRSAGSAGRAAGGLLGRCGGGRAGTEQASGEAGGRA